MLAARDLARAARDSALGARAWLSASRTSAAPVVWYGFDAVPGRSQVAIGGAIKLQHLVDAFPNTPHGFNLLYLGSSRLPAGAVRLAQFSRLKGARLVWNQNGVATPASYPTNWQAANAPMVPLLHMADHVLYQSEFCRLAADRFLGARTGPSEVLYNPVDTEVFCPSAEQGCDEPLVMLLGGSQMHWYRVETAVRVLAEVIRVQPSARLIVTGRFGWTRDRPAAEAAIMGLAQELGVSDRVSLPGPYTQEQAPAIFRQAHVLLHTKINDPCPTVVLEALATGLPVVYSATGGVPELVGDAAGIGVPGQLSWDEIVPPDAAAMARAVLRVMEDYATYSRAARERAVARFDVRPWLQRHREVFARVLR